MVKPLPALLLIAEETEKAEYLSGWQHKCTVPQAFQSSVEASWITGFSHFSMETPYSGSTLLLPGTKFHVWHMHARGV